MDERSASSIPSASFLPFTPTPSCAAIDRNAELSQAQPSARHSFIACTFLLSYLAAYLGVGYAGIRVVEHFWTALFR
jgi:hypothetical protein